MDDDREDTELKRLLRNWHARPSRSADAAREKSLEEIRKLSPKERILLALRLGRRDRELREIYLREREREITRRGR